MVKEDILELMQEIDNQKNNTQSGYFFVCLYIRQYKYYASSF